MYWQKRFGRETPDENLEEEIKLIFRENYESYGYKRIMIKLNLKVVNFTRKSRKYSSYNGLVGKVVKNLSHRRFYTSIPHQKLTTDTTEFKYYEAEIKGNLVIKKLYLVPYLDMFNSEIIPILFLKKQVLTL